MEILYTCMDARMKRRRGARGACCSRPSPIPSLHLFLVGGPPVTAGSLSRPPNHLDAPPPADPLPRMPIHSALRTCSGQVCCAGARREQEAGASERASASVPRHRASVYVLRACMHASSSTQTSAFDDSPWTLARVDGWTGASIAARRLDALASLETGQDTTRRLGGRGKRWTVA